MCPQKIVSNLTYIVKLSYLSLYTVSQCPHSEMFYLVQATKGRLKGYTEKKKKKVKNKDHKMRRGKLEVLCYRMYRTEALTT